MTMDLTINTLKMDDDIQCRERIDGATVESYAQDIMRGDEFPPITVFNDGESHWVADGFHRVKAFQKAGKKTIFADVREGERRDAILHSVGANATNGLRRTNADKRRAVELLLKDQVWSQWVDREIARQCVVSDKTVAKYRAILSAEIPKIDPSTKTDLALKKLQMGTNSGAVAACEENPSGPITDIDRTSTSRTALRNGKPYKINTSNIGNNTQSKHRPANKKGGDLPKKSDGPDYLAHMAKVYLEKIDPTDTEGARRLLNIRDWINELLGEFSVDRLNSEPPKELAIPGHQSNQSDHKQRNLFT